MSFLSCNVCLPLDRFWQRTVKQNKEHVRDEDNSARDKEKRKCGWVWKKNQFSWQNRTKARCMRQKTLFIMFSIPQSILFKADKKEDCTLLSVSLKEKEKWMNQRQNERDIRPSSPFSSQDSSSPSSCSLSLSEGNEGAWNPQDTSIKGRRGWKREKHTEIQDDSSNERNLVITKERWWEILSKEGEGQSLT